MAPRPSQTQRAAPPRAPARGPQQLQADAERQAATEQAEAAERRSMVRGLVLLAVLILLLSIARAGLGRVFPHGWWRL